MTQSPASIWQSSDADARFSDPAAFSRRINRFEWQIRMRNIIEYGAGALAIALFGGTAVLAFSKGQMFLASSSLAIVAGVIVVLFNLRRRASNVERRPEGACLVHLRRQYRHQRDALITVPVWYLGPLVPGLVLFYASFAVGAAGVMGWREALSGLSVPFAISIALFAVIALVNWIAARALDRKIAELDALAR